MKTKFLLVKYASHLDSLKEEETLTKPIKLRNVKEYVKSYN